MQYVFTRIHTDTYTHARRHTRTETHAHTHTHTHKETQTNNKERRTTHNAHTYAYGEECHFSPHWRHGYAAGYGASPACFGFPAIQIRAPYPILLAPCASLHSRQLGSLVCCECALAGKIRAWSRSIGHREQSALASGHQFSPFGCQDGEPSERSRRQLFSVPGRPRVRLSVVATSPGETTIPM